MIAVKLVSKKEASSWIHSLKPSAAIGILLSGDRWSCVDEIFLAKADGEKTVGIVTIASNGEGMSGKPTIVAIYVLPEYRRRIIGFSLLDAAVDYMLSKGLEPICIDALNSKILAMVSRLPVQKRQKINVVDFSMGGAMDAIFEA